MSFNGHVVIDMDSHVREYEDVDRTYREYIDPEYRESFELLSQAVAKRQEAGRPTALFMHPEAIIEPSDESRPLGVYDTFGLLPHQSRNRSKEEARERSGKEPVRRDVNWDPSIRLEDMDRAKIDKSVMFPTFEASYCALKDVGFEGALHRAYHRYMTTYCSESEGRLRWAATATLRDVAASVSEVTHWAERDQNMVGVLVPPSCPDGRLLDNPNLHPLYERCQDLDLPILVHGGVLRPPYTAGATELNNSGFLLRAVYQPWAGMTAVGALIGGGVFDLFPKLRAGVFETGAGWMPWLIEQLDDGYGSRPSLVPNLRREPTEILEDGRLFHAVEPGERYLKHCVEALGEDVWLFSTDYPHTGSPWPDGVSHITDRAELSESAKTKMLGSNALRLCPRLA
ncbi:MAG TPA: amidohydrolase family protein [Chloroflexota bacterium]